MEKTIIKWTIYGFFLALALAFLFVDYKITENYLGGYTTRYVPVFDYVISIIRYSVMGGLAGLVVGGLIAMGKAKVNQ